MSRWPIRTGVAVDKGIVYFAAGMWPSDGIYLYALRADSGEVVWKQFETATRYQRQPHPGSFALLGVAPQGYVVGNDAQVFVPTGRNVPAAFERGTGEFQYYHSAPDGWGNRWGGTWNMVVRDKLVAWRNHHVPDVDTVISEAQPHPEDGLVVFDAVSGGRVLEVQGKLRAVADGSTLYASGGGRIGAYDLDGWLGGKGWNARWESDAGRTYALIKAGDALVSGGDGIAAVRAAGDGRTLWETRAEGQVRGLAVADGRLLLSTTEGQILCYGAAQRIRPPGHTPQTDDAEAQRLAADQAAAARARAVLEAAGARDGYCLALGAGDASFLYHLARQPGMTVFVPEPDAERARVLRQTLDAVGLYGPRAVVQTGDLGNVRYPEFFADLIVVGTGLPESREGFASGELYRLLRPCGGRICIPVTAAEQAPAEVVDWLRQGGIPAAEMEAVPGAVLVSRGKLPRSDDWSHQYANAARTGASADERVRLPLRLLWFGEPGPATLVSRHWQGPAPLCVDGRMVVTGQRHITVVNAYNGRLLWQREFPRAGRWSMPGKGSNVAAVGDSVFLATGGRCDRLDAATGETLRAYALPDIPEMSEDLRKALRTWCFLAVDGGQVLGSMGRSESEGQCLFALSQESGERAWSYLAPGPVANNAVSVDAQTLYLIEQIGSADLEAARRRGLNVDAGKRLVAIDRTSGAIRWATQEQIGSRTTLWLSDGVLVALGDGGFSGYDADSGKFLYGRSASFRRSPVITGGTIYVQPLAFDLHTGEPRDREGVFNDSTSAWNFVRSYGCGTMGGCPNLLAFRSGTIGFYGLEGDTGIHNFPAIRAGCCISAIPANGLLLASPGDAGCSCSYSFQTTLALLPDESRDNWGVFYDRLPNASVERVSLNLGAPGDRRAPDGTLWLATPRPETQSHRRDIAIPFRYECIDGFGPYYDPLGARSVAGTDIPWVFSSGLRGVHHLELDLEILDRGFASWYTSASPTLDGDLAEACWNGYKAYPAQGEDGSVTLRYDREALYLGCRRPLAVDAKPGMAIREHDGPVWEDGAFEILIGNLPSPPVPQATTCLHLAVSPTGARYDAQWTYVSAYGILDIPPLDITVDGAAGDWREEGFRVTSLPGPGGQLRAPENLDPCFRFAWCARGLLVLAGITDNAIREDADVGRLFQGDSIELFMTAGIGGPESFQVVIAPGADGRHTAPRHRFYDRRRATKAAGRLSLEVAGARTPDGYLVEALLPWQNLGIEPVPGTEFGLQVFVNDRDGGPVRGPQALWHPAGSPEKNALAYQGFRLASASAPPIVFTRSERPAGNGLYPARQPHAFPLYEPPLGAHPEQVSYEGRWQSAVSLDGGWFGAEIAIPWQTLADAGLTRNELMVHLRNRGPLPGAPRKGQGFEQLLIIPMARMEPRLVDVRMHFAEPDAAAPGRRVFDIRLQGEAVATDVDVAREASGTGAAVTKEFQGISATQAVLVDFVPKGSGATPDQVPILSGIEIWPSQGRP
ncbi:MAG: PQQ-binding-like beta-propeller repeat protein [Lentisphaeria bacterium]|nr:PQQ-binding-like beta-propeller repeat protein [Lentisphaeria bacterium]